MFIHLHGHSTFSFLEAIGKPGKLAARAKELSQSAVALTDYRGLFGTVKFLQACKDEGVKPILGSELGFVLDVTRETSVRNLGNMVFLAQNAVGYTNLLELISFANTTGVTHFPKVDMEILRQFGEGIICLVGGKESWLGKMILLDESESKQIELLQLIIAILGKDRVFLELIAQDEYQDSDLKKVNTQIIHLASHVGIDLVVSSNFHYIKKGEREARQVALDIKDGKKIYDTDRRKVIGEPYMMSEDEIIAILSHNGYLQETIDTVIATTVRVGESIETSVKLGQVLFPNYETPQDIRAFYEQYQSDLVGE